MKQLIYVVVALLVCNSISAQTLEETSDYLKYIIEENPPFEKTNAEFKLTNSGENDRFLYIIQRLEDGKVMNTLTYLVFFSDIKSISLEKIKSEEAEKYALQINLGKDEDFRSHLIGYKDGFVTEYINDIFISLSEDKALAEKGKRAMMHLFKLKGIEVIDLNMF
ncbi:hypothetical protein [Leeuwenhoekiella sp. W20_SRS_FM14]|uniref:hypothetical protein n=1 Tax=Leeuwenhoekiella sp. W20_SRS_FM14 TaxID=3240270 RepID=UPI003F959FDD